MVGDQQRSAVCSDPSQHRRRRKRPYAEGDLDGPTTTIESEVVQEQGEEVDAYINAKLVRSFDDVTLWVYS